MILQQIMISSKRSHSLSLIKMKKKIIRKLSYRNKYKEKKE